MKYKARLFLVGLALLGIFSISDAQNNETCKKCKMIEMKSLQQIDIGKSTKAGTIDIKDNELKVIAGGADIWGTNDEFHFSYLKLKGDFDISVQILALSDAHMYTKAGIMAREDLEDDSRHAYFQVFPNNKPRNKNNGGCEFQYRTEKGGQMKAFYPADAIEKTDCKVEFPKTWLRMKRHGDIFESYFSNDGKIWIHYASYTQKMPVELFVGLAVTAHNADAFTTASFASFKK